MKKQKTGRIALPAETAIRKKEMSSIALIIEFTDDNRRLFWTNEFSTTFPAWKRGKLGYLIKDFMNFDLFQGKSHRIRSAAIFDTRHTKELRQEYKLLEFHRGQWMYTNYAQLTV